MKHNDFSLDGNMDGDCANNIIYLRKESLWGQLTLQTLLSEGLTHTCSLTAWICLPFKLLMIKSLLLNDCIVAQS